MGDPRNWSDRKLGEVRAANIRTAREALRSATIEEHGERGWKLQETHACYAHRSHWTVYATCMGCLSKKVVNLAALQHGVFAHAPFPRLMAALKCVTCGCCAGALHFERREGVRRIEMGCLIARPAETAMHRKDES